MRIGFGKNADVEGLTAFVTALVNGVSVLARDGASRAALNAAVGHAMRAWDGTVRRN